MNDTPPSHGVGPAPPCVLVIFGAGGDLTQRKLIPALGNLSASGLLTDRFAVVGFDRLELDDEAYRDALREPAAAGVEGSDDQHANDVFSRIHYVKGDFLEETAYARLGERIAQVAGERAIPGNVIFYLATPPRFFSEITDRLGRAGLTREEAGSWRRVVIEKPFGRDLTSARTLNASLLATLSEDQIYRIDHYLGKETVQNILVYRFANGTTEPLWNHRYIDHVQITVAESVGVGRRAGYYEHAGALRDMVPNHLLVLLSVITMEPPNSFEANAVREEIIKVLRAVQPISPQAVLTQTVRGQYGPGPGGQQAYRNEPDVDPSSGTDTFVALKLSIDNWRWAGVPFYLRTGKCLAAKWTEIAIHYKRAPFVMFRDTPVQTVAPNVLVLRLHPREGIGFTFDAKVPGPSMGLGNVDMDFCYSDYFGNPPSTGYETLIYDCMSGDASLFRRADSVEAGWSLVQPILDVWNALPPRDFPNYAGGSWGPAAADELLARDGRRWRTPRAARTVRG